MCVTNEEQASRFLERVCLHQEQLSAYACSLTKCQDKGHDLYSDTLLKCYERINTHGFYGEAYVPYLITAIKLNFYHAQRDRVEMQSLEGLHHPSEEPSGEEEHKIKLALYTGIMSFISAHFNTDEASVFELHTHGLAYCEIGFATGLSGAEARSICRRIKYHVRKNFGYTL